jgi:hypothetical protein
MWPGPSSPFVASRQDVLYIVATASQAASGSLHKIFPPLYAVMRDKMH